MVIFAIVSSLLFIVVVILFVHYEKLCCPISETKKRNDEDDRSSLLEITHIEQNIHLQQVSIIYLRIIRSINECSSLFDFGKDRQKLPFILLLCT